MFARVTISKTPPDKNDAVAKIMQESVIPAAQNQKGFIACYSMGDDNGKGITISIWESEEDAINNEQSGYYQEQIAKFGVFFTEPPVREGYTVRAHS